MLGPVGSAERTPTMTTTDSEMMEDPVRPVIDDELVDRLMAQGRRAGFGAFWARRGC